MTVALFPADIHKQKTICQGHPPNWANKEGGDYDLVVVGGGPAALVVASMHQRSSPGYGEPSL